ncbi:MAG: SPFH domain-containing protein [Pseudolysinimonas sp.]|uniref:SPFH domain-containing protein n=1 Tax=Pseudolysinimonas sp. TaxID=2680009 RepID=UPI003266D884
MLTRQVTAGRWVVVQSGERAVVRKDGTYVRTEVEGRHRRHRREEFWVVDIRERRIVIPPQEVLTSDGLQVRTSLFLAFSITDPTAWLTNVADAQGELHALAQVALRKAVAAMTLDELLAARDTIATTDVLGENATRLGVAITSFELRDLTLPQELRRAYSETALARAEAGARLERARGEAAAVRSLANTAQVLEAHPSILQLRALDAAAQVIVKIVPAGDTES